MVKKLQEIGLDERLMNRVRPLGIDSQLAFKIPWGIRVFLGTNLSQTGFSVNYQRVAENVWFPVTYGTEFRVSVLFRYKRTITLFLRLDFIADCNAALPPCSAGQQHCLNTVINVTVPKNTPTPIGSSELRRKARAVI